MTSGRPSTQVLSAAAPPPLPLPSTRSNSENVLWARHAKLGDLLIVVREVEPPIFPADAFFLKQGIDFQQDAQASNEGTYVNLDETPLIHCQGCLSPWLGAASACLDSGCDVAGRMGTDDAAARGVPAAVV